MDKPLSIVMRGHSGDALCEICGKRPGTAVVTDSTGCEAWACFHCRGIDPADYGEDEYGNPLAEENPTRYPPMAMLPNDHHPGPRCSCRECLWAHPKVQL